jgi:hypothetical protein
MNAGKALLASLIAGAAAFVLMCLWGLDMGLGDWRAWALLGLTSTAFVGLGYGLAGMSKRG